MPQHSSLYRAAVAALATVALSAAPAAAQKKYDPGASDTEIKIGQTVPFSGPGFSLCGHRQDAGRLYADDQ